MGDMLEGEYLQNEVEKWKASRQPRRTPLPAHDGSTNQPSIGVAITNMLKRWITPVSDDVERKTYGQPWQAPGIAEKVADFLGRGETVLDLIARSGISLYDIKTLSKSELRQRIDAGAVRRSQEPRAPMVVLVGPGANADDPNEVHGKFFRK